MMEQNISQAKAQKPNHLNAYDPGFDIDLLALVKMISRRKFVILIALIAVIGSAFAALEILPPRYRAQTTVVIEEQPNTDITGLFSALKMSDKQLTSEVEILRSRTLARKVIKRLRLYNDPSFNPHIKTSDGFADQLQGFLQPNMSGETQIETPLLAHIIKEFMRSTIIRAIDGSQVLHIGFESKDPKKAAEIANALTDIYIEEQLNNKLLQTRKVSEWLNGRLNALRENARASQEKIHDFRDQHQVYDNPGLQLITKEIADLEKEIAKTELKIITLTTRIKHIQSLPDKGLWNAGTKDVLSSPRLNALTNNIITANQKIADLSLIYGEKHYKLQAAISDRDALYAHIKDEVQNILSALSKEKAMLQSTVYALKNKLDKAVDRRSIISFDMIHLEQMSLEAEADKKLYETLLANYNLTTQQAYMQTPDSRIISYAAVPLIPSFPNKPLMIGLSGLAGLFLGLGFALLLEKLDNKFREAGQLEKFSGFPIYGAIPKLDAIKDRNIARAIFSEGAHATAETVRSLRMAVKMRNKDEFTRNLITVTSSMPDEGKSTLSTWLAQLTARSGEKVIIVDCDFRRPSLHKTFGKSNNRSLIDYLTQNASLEEIIHKDDPSGVHLILSKDVHSQALDLIDSKRMHVLIQMLKSNYDLVILDAPTILSISDALILANASDLTLYCVAWQKTPQEAVAAGIKQLKDIGCTDIGMVLTRIDSKSHESSGLYHSDYYTPQARPKKKRS